MLYLLYWLWHYGLSMYQFALESELICLIFCIFHVFTFGLIETAHVLTWIIFLVTSHSCSVPHPLTFATYRKASLLDDLSPAMILVEHPCRLFASLPAQYLIIRTTIFWSLMKVNLDLPSRILMNSFKSFPSSERIDPLHAGSWPLSICNCCMCQVTSV